MKRALRIFSIFILTCLSAIGLALAPIWDISTVNDSDLQRQTVTVIASENLHTTFVDIAGRLSTTTKQKIQDLNSLKSVSPKNSTHLSLIAATEKLVTTYTLNSKYSYFSCTKYDECHLSLIRDIGFVLARHAAFAASNGDQQQAEMYVEQGLALSAKLAQDPAVSTIQLLIAIAISHEHITVIENNNLTISNPEMYTLPLTAIRNSLIDEYFLFKTATNQTKERYWLQPNRTDDEIANFTRDAIKIGTSDCEQALPDSEVAHLDNFIAHKKSKAVQPWYPNWLGNQAQAVWLNAGVGAKLRSDICDINNKLTKSP